MDDDSVLAARMQYLSAINDRLAATINSADRFVNFAGIIAAGTITVGIVGSKPLIAILAPFALLIVFVYQIQLYTDAERYVVLLEHMEGCLNQDLRDRIFLTSTALDRSYRNRRSIRLIQGIYALGLSGSISINAILTFRTYGTWWLIIDIVLIVGCLTVLVVAMRELTRAQEKVLESLRNPSAP